MSVREDSVIFHSAGYIRDSCLDDIANIKKTVHVGWTTYECSIIVLA